MTRKIGRNEICPCGSGLKYKYCCIKKELRQRNVPIDNLCTSCGTGLSLDLTDDIMNYLASAELPIKNFCKDNDLYFFGLCITVGETEELEEKLRTNTLTKNDIIDSYKKNFKKEPILGLLDAACEEMEIFGKRKHILKDAFEAHFDEKYTLTVPALFTQLEGLLRDIGGIKNSENVRPIIPVDIWEKRLAFTIKDDSQFFNGFITKLFEGSKDSDSFNRNPILHGFKIDYHSEEHSMLVILSILELRLFNWWKEKLPIITDKFKVMKK